MQGDGLPQVAAELQDPGKRQPGRRVQLSADPTSLTNPQPLVCDLLCPDQPMFLVDTGAAASCISINMLDNKEQCSINSPSDMPHHVLAVNGENIQVFGKVAELSSLTTSYTALPCPLLGWDFLKNPLARLEAAP